MPREIIDGKAVQDLVKVHAIQSATILGQPGGWAVLVRHGVAEQVVAAQRARKPRLWRNLNTAAAYVRDELGLPRFEVDTVAYDPDAARRTRPDQVERLRLQREAIAHDSWFRSQVRQALDGMENGTNPVVEDDEVQARLGVLKADLARRAR
jgi:hypothetical protein